MYILYSCKHIRGDSYKILSDRIDFFHVSKGKALSEMFVMFDEFKHVNKKKPKCMHQK